MSDTIWLQRPGGDVPWGFRISGGRDYQEPVRVSRLTAGSIASTGLTLGDLLLRIGDDNTSCLTQAQANELIKNSGNLLQLCISKGGTEQSSSPSSHGGGAQVANPSQTSSAVHDLFQDMYRYPPPTHGASSPDNNQPRQPIPAGGTQGFSAQQSDQISKPPTGIESSTSSSRFVPIVVQNTNSSSQSNKAASGLSSPSKSTPSSFSKGYSTSSTPNDDNIFSEYNQGTQQGNVYRNYKPDGSLNSSTDSGVYLDTQQNLNHQNSNLSSLSGSNVPEPSSLSSCASEISDTTYTVASQEEDVLPPPSPSPPPLPSQPPPDFDFPHPPDEDFLSAVPPSPSLPPPPPVSITGEPSNSKTSAWNSSQGHPTNPDGNSDEYSTRLNHQLASMNINNYNRQPSQPGSQPTTPYSQQSGSQPTTPYSQQPGSQPTTPYSPYDPPKIRGYQSPSSAAPPQLNPQSYHHSPTTPPGAPGYHPLANVPPPPAPPISSYSPYSNNTYHSPTGAPEVKSQKVPPVVPEKPSAAVPDAVVNMAAKGEKDKKPFAYAADMDEIKHHRERVRRKPGGIPSYQNILNLPKFEEPKPRLYDPNAGKSKTPSTPPAGVLPQGPGEGVFTHSQYNSPLGMYSSDTAEEVFVAQSSGLVTGVAGEVKAMPKIRLPGTKETKDITESETYKMIHGIGNARPKPKVVMPAQQSFGRQPRQPAPDDEMSFSGVNQPQAIPSKSFHRLQSMTDNEPEIDTTSIRPKNLAVDDDSVSGYDEASIRYMGKNIPSKSFRMLQNMTGGAETGAQAMPKRRPMRKAEAPEPEKNADDIVDISYVGGNIPSRSFKMLQQSIGQTNGSAPQHTTHEDNDHNPKGRTVKVVKLRSADACQSQRPNHGATDF